MLRTYQPKKRQRSKEQGARLPEENAHSQRPQGSCPPQSERQSETQRLTVMSENEQEWGKRKCFTGRRNPPFRHFPDPWEALT